MQNLSDKVDEQLLKRYVKGNVSETEELIVRKWFADEKLYGLLSEYSRGIWENLQLDSNTGKVDGPQILDHIHHQIKREESVFIKKSGKLSVIFGKLSRVAAVLLLPVLLTTVLLYNEINTVYSDNSHSEIYAPVGTRTAFFLPDGSTGWLNGGSSLKFPTNFQRKARNIELVGEAYLAVSEDSRKPFTVSVRNIEVKVHGTAFNVMAYPDESTTEVTLESGNIEVLKKQDGYAERIALLKPDQSLIFDHENGSARLISVISSDKTAWKEGKLVFKYEPLSEVIKKINRWYNVNIHISDPELKDHIYYGTFQDETLEEVLKLLQMTAPISYRDTGRERKPDGTYHKRIIELYSKK